MTQNTNGARRSERLQEEKLLHGLSNTKKRKTPAQGRRGEEKQGVLIMLPLMVYVICY